MDVYMIPFFPVAYFPSKVILWNKIQHLSESITRVTILIPNRR